MKWSGNRSSRSEATPSALYSSTWFNHALSLLLSARKIPYLGSMVFVLRVSSSCLKISVR